MAKIQSEKTASFLPSDIRQKGSLLLDQQMWCWGQDIGYPEGNLLIRYGFQRIPAPKDSRYSSTYRRGCWGLWGFGLWYGGLFLKRHDFRPLLAEPGTSQPLVWCADELPPLHRPTHSTEVGAAGALLWAAVQQIVRYEIWTAEHTGVTYRNNVLNAFPNKRKGLIPAEAMVDAWLEIAECCASSFENLEFYHGYQTKNYPY